ncbi:hypothetical protein PN36_05490 [Candidatus Thiomargarita nelsonii]|uniref:Uncharacterized protein n=1 Tax=Candidatus Thiomargarita nelsonii TaxID=1003181 RepID=A0A4E0QVW5_9GAMM|nr:hypothetical protein PN36_05490 [Candidatus Thiomargarita nelsonii]
MSNSEVGRTILLLRNLYDIYKRAKGIKKLLIWVILFMILIILIGEASDGMLHIIELLKFL